jgi:competence protein ComFC
LAVWLLELVLPSRCVSCGTAGPPFCERCCGLVVPVSAPLCARCGSPTEWPVERCRECAGRRLAFASARAAIFYRGPVRPLVRAWKEGGLRPLSSLAAELVAERVPKPMAEVITYIPADGDRSLRRGHHPAEGLARELGRRWELELRPLLSRRRSIGRQTGLGREERRANVREAFGCRGSVRGRVVLVDDVYTTGATVGAGATALRAAGAREIHVVTLARTVR